MKFNLLPVEVQEKRRSVRQEKWLTYIEIGLVAAGVILGVYGQAVIRYAENEASVYEERYKSVAETVAAGNRTAELAAERAETVKGSESDGMSAAGLLVCLAETRPPDIYVESVSRGQNGFIIKGTAGKKEALSLWQGKLAKKITPGNIGVKHMEAKDMRWRFELLLESGHEERP